MRKRKWLTFCGSGSTVK